MEKSVNLKRRVPSFRSDRPAARRCVGRRCGCFGVIDCDVALSVNQRETNLRDSIRKADAEGAPTTYASAMRVWVQLVVDEGFVWIL